MDRRVLRSCQPRLSESLLQQNALGTHSTDVHRRRKLRWSLRALTRTSGARPQPALAIGIAIAIAISIAIAIAISIAIAIAIAIAITIAIAIENFEACVFREQRKQGERPASTPLDVPEDAV